MQTVDRAMDVLEAVAESTDPVSAKALARRVGCSLSTAYNLINVLVDRGYLVRASAGYLLGHQAPGLNRAFWNQMRITDDLHSLLGDIQRATRAPTYYSTCRSGDIVVADMTTLPAQDRDPVFKLGNDLFAHGTAHGKVLLSSWSAAERRRYLAATGMQRLTPNTITSREQLERQLRQVRRSGMATEVEEVVEGMACLATPVWSDDRTVVAAVSVAVPIEDFHRRQRQLAAAVRRGAQEAAVIMRATGAARPVARHGGRGRARAGA